ncbi:MAG: outer membrane beta-barrel protein [Hyphomicrobiaceae bacterium]|nr:outer membrane beta-barrel protein [Hyphomicrobiaceae bacterium]
MTATVIARAPVALLFCLAAVASSQARAQNYDGAGLLRFGIFGQADAASFDIQRPAEASGSLSEASFGGGVSYGYDLLLHGGWVLGIESDIAVDSWQADRTQREYTIDYQATLRGRLGAYVHPAMLVYATAGASFLGVGFTGAPDPLTTSRARENDTLIGWTAGVGTELEWHGIAFFGEYLYAGYDTFSAREAFDDGVTVTVVDNEADVDQHLFRFGVKLIIGHDYRAEGGYGPLK